MGVCSSAESVREPPLFDLTMERLERRAAVYEIKYGADCEDCYDIIAQWLEEVDIDGSAPCQDIPPSPERHSMFVTDGAADEPKPCVDWGVFEGPQPSCGRTSEPVVNRVGCLRRPVAW